MDESQKENQDLVVGDDGSMNQESQQENKSTENNPTNIEVKSEETPQEQPINEATPPPEDALINDSSTEHGESSAEDAVSFIAGTKTEESKTEDDSIVENNAEDKEVSAEQPDNTDNTQVVQAPAEETVESSSAEDIANSSEQTYTPQDNSATPQESTGAVVQPDKSGMSNNEHNNPHEHRNNKKLALIVTIFVAIVLSGAAIFAYLSAQNNTEESSPSSNVSNVESTEPSPVSEVTPATQNDIDETVNEIDETIDALDNSELNEETLSDETLGL